MPRATKSKIKRSKLKPITKRPKTNRKSNNLPRRKLKNPKSSKTRTKLLMKWAKGLLRGNMTTMSKKELTQQNL